MRFITLLRHVSFWKLFFAVVTSFLSGVFSTYVISLIHAFVNKGIENDPHYMLKFVTGALLFGIMGVLSSFFISLLTRTAIFKLRTSLSAQVLQTSFQKSERNLDKILPVLTEDINVVSNCMNRLPPVMTAWATTVGCIAYLFFLSWKFTIGSLVLFGIVFLINYLSLPYLKKQTENARNVLDQIYKNFEGLVYGMKELKLNKDHRNVYLSKKIEPNCKEEKKFKVKAGVFYALSNRTLEVILFLGIGMFIFCTGKFAWMDNDAFTGYLVVLVFVVGPLSIVANYIQLLKQTQVSLERIDSLGSSLEKEPDFNTSLQPSSQWNEAKDAIFSLDNVYFSYEVEEERERFMIGPINLQIKKGEIIYIIGGNGTGKTTLIKLIAGLYVPTSGQLAYKGVTIEEKDLDNYRTHFAAVFIDNYLFDDLFYIDPAIIDSDAGKLLKQLEIEHKVFIKDQKISTLKLSYGQRKRLAMLVAILEDKEIYIFDEWAANQDAHFKEVFYVKLLPDLKKRGKTVIAISHDEKYSKQADRIFKMAKGQLKEVSR